MWHDPTGIFLFPYDVQENKFAFYGKGYRWSMTLFESSSVEAGM